MISAWLLITMIMVKRYFIVLAIVLTLQPLWGQASKPGPKPERPNIIFITADDLSAIRLGCYGNKVIKTPNLDAFSEEALQFNRAYCQVPQCGPSRVSFFTGVRPETSGMWDMDDREQEWQQRIPGGVSLQRHLQDNGYRVFVHGKLFDNRSGQKDHTVAHPGAPENADVPIKKLEELAAQGSPFAYFVGFVEPHPVRWSALEKRGKYRAFTELYEPNELELQGPVMWKGGKQATHESLATAYGVISYLDHEVGRILRKVKELNLWNNSIIVFTCADHGHRLGESASGWPGTRWGKWWPGEVDSHVPLLMRIPGSKSMGAETPGIVEGVDLYPTFLELCKLPLPPQKLEGHSFAELFETPDRLWKDVAYTGFPREANAHSVVTQTHRLIKTDQETMFFDLRTDPKGQNNIAGTDPETEKKLTALLERGYDPNWKPDPAR